MPDTKADIGYDSTFGIEGETPGQFVDVAEVVSINPPSMQRGTEEVTHLQSPDRYKEFVPSMVEGGDASIGLNFVPSETTTLIAAFDAGSGTYRIKFPDGATLVFKGIVTSFEIGELSNGKMSATFTVKQNGKATFAEVA
jgi:tail tube protein